MSKNTFAKLFDVEHGHQVLCRLSINTTGPEDTTDIKISTWIDGIECGITLSGFSESIYTPQEKLESITQEEADKFYLSMLDLTSGNITNINVNDPEILD